VATNTLVNVYNGLHGPIDPAVLERIRYEAGGVGGNLGGKKGGVDGRTHTGISPTDHGQPNTPIEASPKKSPKFSLSPKRSPSHAIKTAKAKFVDGWQNLRGNPAKRWWCNLYNELGNLHH
jgi:hypothetical protein